MEIEPPDDSIRERFDVKDIPLHSRCRNSISYDYDKVDFTKAIEIICGGGIVSRKPSELKTRRYYYLGANNRMRVLVGDFVADWGGWIVSIEKPDLQATDYRIEAEVPGGERR